MKRLLVWIDRMFALMTRTDRAQARSYESGFAPRMRLQPIPVRSRRR